MRCAEISEPIDLPFGLYVNSGGPKEAQVQLYLPGGANKPTWNEDLMERGQWEGTLAPPSECE